MFLRLCSSVLVLSVLLLQPETRAQQPLLSASTRPQQSIPFRLEHGFLITVEGRIGSLTRLKFILDTGSSRSFIDRRIADRLQVARRKGKVLNFNKWKDVETAVVSELQVGPLNSKDAPVGVGDLKKFSEFAEDADAIVGMDLLRSTGGFLIDYQTGLLTFRIPSANALKTADSTVLTIPASVQDRTLHLVIDTGIQGVLLYASHFRKRNLRFQAHDMEKVFLGKLAGEQIILPGIRLGPDQIQDHVILLRGEPRDLPANLDGYVGIKVLRARVIEFDFESNILRWQ